MTSLSRVIVVGSGPAGAQAAQEAIEQGFEVFLLDFGNDDPDAAGRVPDAPFSAIRRSDRNQRQHFINDDDLRSVKEIQVGAHLSPPRQFVTKDVARLLPFQSESFRPLQSLALGGLGAAWGAGAYTFDSEELRRIGLPASEMRAYYHKVARDIGISGVAEDDTAPYAFDVTAAQPPLEVDANAASLLETYAKRKDVFRELHFVLGRAPVAALSVELPQDPTRKPNPYHDMDFYSDSRRSVYRPKYTIEQLRRNPRFHYIGRALVQDFAEHAGGVSVRFYSDADGRVSQLEGATLLLAANAINTARIVLRSFGLYGARVPLLSNPYHYIPMLNLRMLGRRAHDRRHSLAQLFGLYNAPHRNGDYVTAALYSYRSLLLYKLVKEMPLDPRLGLLAARAMMTCFTIAGVHHPDTHSRQKWLELERGSTVDILRAHYEITTEEQRLIALDLSGVKRAMRALGCLPLRTINPGHGSSIHYAGTLPNADIESAIRTDSLSRVRGTRSVFVADSSSWNYLPAKGLTFTIMANARRVAADACRELRMSVSDASLR